MEWFVSVPLSIPGHTNISTHLLSEIIIVMKLLDTIPIIMAILSICRIDFSNLDK